MTGSVSAGAATPKSSSKPSRKFEKTLPDCGELDSTLRRLFAGAGAGCFSTLQPRNPHLDSHRTDNPDRTSHLITFATTEGKFLDNYSTALATTWHNCANSCAFPTDVASCMSSWRSRIHCATSSSHIGTKSSRNRPERSFPPGLTACRFEENINFSLCARNCLMPFFFGME